MFTVIAHKVGYWTPQESFGGVTYYASMTDDGTSCWTARRSDALRFVSLSEAETEAEMRRTNGWHLRGFDVKAAELPLD